MPEEKDETMTPQAYVDSAKKLLSDYEMLQVVSQHLGIIAFAVDDQRVLDCNERASEITRYPIEELRGLHLIDLVPPEKRTGHDRFVADYLILPTPRMMRGQTVFGLLCKDETVKEVAIMLLPGVVRDTPCIVAGIILY